MTLHHTHKQEIEAFARFWSAARDPRAPFVKVLLPDEQAAAFYRSMMPTTEAGRRRLAVACSKLTTANCWFAMYRVVRDQAFLDVLNEGGVLLHWANDRCHVPGKKECDLAGCNWKPRKAVSA